MIKFGQESFVTECYHAKYANLIYPSEQTMILNLISKIYPPKKIFCLGLVGDFCYGFESWYKSPCFSTIILEEYILVHFSNQGPNFSKSKILKG